MFENGPSDRMQFVGMGELTHPGKCMVCGNATCEHGYIRLGVYFDYEGEMYLCRTCAEQAAEVIGCLIPEEAEHLRLICKSLADENADVKRELEVSNERLSHFNALLSSVDPAPSGSSHLSDSPVSKEPVNSDHAPKQTASGSAGTKPKPVKSTAKSQRGNPAKSTESNGSDSISV